MKINGVGPGRAFGQTGSVRTSKDDTGSHPEEIRIGAVDRADISNEGVSRAQEALASEAAEVGIEPAHFELIQTRIDSGFYKQPEVLDEIARRIVAAGDL